MLLFFLLCGRYLDHAMRRKTRAVAGNLAALKAEVAHRFDGGGELVMVPAAALQPGDRLLVRPGERVPADGIVISGTSEIDDSLVTGETARRDRRRRRDDLCRQRELFRRADHARDRGRRRGTLIDEVERLLEKAVAAKSRYVRLADRAARLYAPVVHATAALTAVGWLAAGASLHDAIITAIAVLIITCPCALALAIPAVQVVASGALFRAGVILNAGDAIERLAEVDTVVFDKTGTLTLPEPRVDNAADASIRSCSRWRRGSRLSSRHPLAAAVAREARDRDAVRRRDRGAGAGRARHHRRQRGAARQPGVLRHRRAPTARLAEPGTSVIAFSHAGRTAVLPVRQTLRPDAVAVVRRCASAASTLVILSGDRPARSRRSRRRSASRTGAAGLDAGREDRRHRSAEGARAAACSWSATASTTRRRWRPRMCRCRRSAPPTSPRRRPTRSSSASGSRRCSTPSPSPAAPAA